MAGDWVVVADGGRGRSRDAVAAVRGLAAAGYRPVLAVGPGAMRGPRSRYVARVEHVPPVEDPTYPARLREIVAALDALTIVPAGESVVHALGLVPDGLTDKRALAVGGREAGFDVPKDRVFSEPADLMAAADELAYPVVIKPAMRTFTAFRADGPQGLVHRSLPPGPVLAQEVVGGVPTAVMGVIAGGELHAAVHERWLRTFPPVCGLAAAAETIAADEGVERRLVTLLGGYEGIFVAQFVGGALIDLNLRVASTHALGEAAGVNIVGVWCEFVRGLRREPRRARAGVSWRWLEGDVRTTVAQVRAREISFAAAARRLKPRRGTAHSIESLLDPGPSIARAMNALERTATKINRKVKP